MASIPIIATKETEKATAKLWQHTQQGLKNEQFKEKIPLENQQLFDICACKEKQIPCHQVQCQQDKGRSIHIKCQCDCSKKISSSELNFLFDQIGPKKMVMLGIIANVTLRWRRAEKKETALRADSTKGGQRIDFKACHMNLLP